MMGWHRNFLQLSCIMLLCSSAHTYASSCDYLIEEPGCLPPGSVTSEQLLACSEKGDSEAQLLLFTAYSQGNFGLAPNAEKAAHFTKILAEKGCAQAQAHLGQLYYQGNGVVPNIANAKIWWEKAASNGNAQGMCLLPLPYAWMAIH